MKQINEANTGLNLRQLALALLLIAGTSLGLAACDTNDSMEEAGESIDEAAEEVEDEVDDNT